MKKYFSFLLLLGMLVAVSPIFSGCSDDNTETPQPEPEPTPDVPDNPTPIQWDEMEAKAGERGVGIKVTNLSENDFSFELTPGANVQSYRWTYIRYRVCITTCWKKAVRALMRTG